MKELKTAVNFVRNERAQIQRIQDKIKWFDKLPYDERKEHYQRYKGNKQDLCFIKAGDKSSIFNKVHYGVYNI